jgi:hypothetical protein
VPFLDDEVQIVAQSANPGVEIRGGRSERMLRDEGVVAEPVWADADGSTKRDRERELHGKRELHRDIDRELRRIAHRRAALDADEARWLREAERHRIWRKLGFATALEYLEDVFGHAPRTAKDRLRVAKALGELPGLEAELRRGAMSYSAVKELTRVMTPATEAQWLASARGRNVRDIAELVEGRKKGDVLSDPKDPSLITRDVVFTLDARRQALLEQTRAMFEAERGEHIENAALLEALCMSALRAGDGERPDGDWPDGERPDDDRRDGERRDNDRRYPRSVDGWRTRQSAPAGAPDRRAQVRRLRARLAARPRQARRDPARRSRARRVRRADRSRGRGRGRASSGHPPTATDIDDPDEDTRSRMGAR